MPTPNPSASSRPYHQSITKSGREKVQDASRPNKRRCVSNACIACRRRKSKCDGNTPACAACASVYHTECVYDPNSDHRRKGVYKKDIDKLKTQNSTLQTLIEAILNYPEESVHDLVHQIRTCDSLEDLAESILAESAGNETGNGDILESKDSPGSPSSLWAEDGEVHASLEAELSGKMGTLKLEDGQIRFIGATSNLILVPSAGPSTELVLENIADRSQQQENPITSWTRVTKDHDLIVHLINMYFTWHYPFFTTLSKDLFYKEFLRGQVSGGEPQRYCTSLLVNAMLALGCHFTQRAGSRSNPNDSATAGDHFFKEAKRLIYENDEGETPRLPTVQALALMSVREAGAGREAKGWVYSGMSFRMAQDLGLHLDPGTLKESDSMSDVELDARRVTFWGCFLFDKLWSNYLGRMPQLPRTMITVPKYDVFPAEDAENWFPYTDNGVRVQSGQPSRIRAVSLQISNLCEISNDILLTFYNPNPPSTDKTSSPHIRQGKQNNVNQEFKKLGELFTRLEDWRKKLSPELEAKEGSLPSTLVMHMFHQTLYIHLFRPFLKFSHPENSHAAPLSHLDPRKACLGAATTMSKYLRFYKRRYGLKQICNVAAYFIHTACTIHLLNLPEKPALRDIVQGLSSLEEMGEYWLVARRALVIVDVLVQRWGIEVPGEAEAILRRARPEAKRFGLQKATMGSAEMSEFGSDYGSPASNVSDAGRSPTAMFAGMAPPGSIRVAAVPNQKGYQPQMPRSPATSASFGTPNNWASSSPFTSGSGPLMSYPHTAMPSTAPSPGSTNSPSPAAMFGSAAIAGLGLTGEVEEQDWWLKDQSTLGFLGGFESWGDIADPIGGAGMIGQTPGTWMNNVEDSTRGWDVSGGGGGGGVEGNGNGG